MTNLATKYNDLLDENNALKSLNYEFRIKNKNLEIVLESERKHSTVLKTSLGNASKMLEESFEHLKTAKKAYDLECKKTEALETALKGTTDYIKDQTLAQGDPLDNPTFSKN